MKVAAATAEPGGSTATNEVAAAVSEVAGLKAPIDKGPKIAKPEDVIPFDEEQGGFKDF